MAAVDLSAHTGTYQGLVDATGDTPCPILESFLRAVTSSIFSRRGGALLHAASVAIGGSGYAFCGLSGAGKTTLVEGTPDGMYLSDDQTIVTMTGEGFSLWGSPFSGLAARRASGGPYPLKALVLLASERGAATRIVRRHDRASTAADLLRHVCCFERDADEARRALLFAARVVATVPVFSVRRHTSTSLSSLISELDQLIAHRPLAWQAA